MTSVTPPPGSAKHQQFVRPSQLKPLWRSLIGSAIVGVRRQLFTPDYDCMSPARRDEDADGATELAFSDGQRVSFMPETETQSVLAALGAMPRWGDSSQLADVGRNGFWRERIGRPVVEILCAEPDPNSSPARGPVTDEYCEFALEFLLEGAPSFALEFGGAGESDCLRVTAAAAEGSRLRRSLAP